MNKIAFDSVEYLPLNFLFFTVFDFRDKKSIGRAIKKKHLNSRKSSLFTSYKPITNK